MVERALYAYWAQHQDMIRAPQQANRPGRPLSVGIAKRKVRMEQMRPFPRSSIAAIDWFKPPDG